MRLAAGAAVGRACDCEAAQGLVEYALILLLVAVVSIVSLVFFGDQLSMLLSMVSNAA